MADIQKGIISTIEPSPVDDAGHKTTARVFSLTGGSVTRPLIIPWYLRSTMGDLKPGDEVVFVLFEDMTGWIIGRFDGNFQTFIPYDLIVDGNTQTTGDAIVNGSTVTEGDADIVGNCSAADFISDGYGSSNSHTHTGNLGSPTSPPN